MLSQKPTVWFVNYGLFWKLRKYPRRFPNSFINRKIWKPAGNLHGGFWRFLHNPSLTDHTVWRQMGWKTISCLTTKFTPLDCVHLFEYVDFDSAKNWFVLSWIKSLSLDLHTILYLNVGFFLKIGDSIFLITWLACSDPRNSVVAGVC